MKVLLVSIDGQTMFQKIPDQDPPPGRLFFELPAHPNSRPKPKKPLKAEFDFDGFTSNGKIPRYVQTNPAKE